MPARDAPSKPDVEALGPSMMAFGGGALWREGGRAGRGHKGRGPIWD